MDNIFIIHFSPPKLYPPVQNFVRLLETLPLEKNITLITTGDKYKGLSDFKTAHSGINIIRLGTFRPGFSKVARIINYCRFYFGCLFYLILKRPSKVLYYETLSSFPVYIYKRFINCKAVVMIHYHEYTSPLEYKNGMVLNNLFHQKEKWLYPRVEWLSHTNHYRVKLFMNDIKPLILSHVHTIPNYTPATWYREPKSNIGDPVRFIYLGALSMETMFTREMAEWVLSQEGKVVWDIISYKPEKNARDYIEGLNSPLVHLKDGFDYESLPTIISQYDIGVILYKGHIPNYVFNAPNKLFEYLSAGLDVWYPHNIIGCYDYDSTEYWPKVLRIDFNKLQNCELNELLERKKNYKRPLIFKAEDALLPLAKTFLQ